MKFAQFITHKIYMIDSLFPRLKIILRMDLRFYRIFFVGYYFEKWKSKNVITERKFINVHGRIEVSIISIRVTISISKYGKK